MGDPIEVRVEGLKEFNRSLRDLGKEFPKMLRVALNEAADVVVQGAVPLIPKRSGRAARSVRAQSTRTRARVAAGAARVPYYPWLDFGGKAGNAERQYRRKGRYIYKAYFKARDSGEFGKILSDSLVDVAERAGLVIE